MRSALVRVGAVLLLLAIGLAAVLGLNVKRQSAGTIHVLATTTQVQDFVRNVGGDRIAVVPVMQPDEDPHDYQPTATDARAFSDADAIFANGVGLETWFDSLAANIRPGVPVVKLGEQPGIALRGGDADEPLGDPHVWFDPTNVQRMVAKIRDTLNAVDPAGQPTYDANAAAYIDQLGQLDRDITAQWATVPPEQRRLVTNHDAFGYYVDRYGLTFVGSVIPSLSSEAQPSAAETQRLIQAIRAQGVRAIFTESSINPQLARQIAQQADVRVYSNLYGDTLGKPGSGADTYIAMMRYDTQTMVAGMTSQ